MTDKLGRNIFSDAQEEEMIPLDRFDHRSILFVLALLLAFWVGIITLIVRSWQA
jgi:hypothetical protein